MHPSSTLRRAFAGAIVASVAPLALAGGLDVPEPPAFFGEARQLKTPAQWFDLGDVDGDGIVDAVATGNASFQVALGDGFGGFRQPTTTPFATDTSWVAAADFDEDGRCDVAVNLFGGTATLVFLSTGGGSFGAPTALPHGGTEPRSIAAGDVDGDGHVDLAVANYVAGGIAVYRGDGAGGFVTHALLGAGVHPAQVHLADLDGDGDLDLVSLDGQTSKLYVYDNLAGTFFFHAVVATSAFFAERFAIGDATGDGLPDLAVANGSGTPSVAFLAGIGGLDFAPPQAVLQPAKVESLALHDADGDGRADLWTSFVNERIVRVALSAGNGTFPAQTDRPWAAFSRLAFADVQNDGRPDVVGAKDVLAARPIDEAAGSFSWAGFIPSPGQGLSGGELVDIDGDQDLDIVLPDDLKDRIFTLQNDGSGGFGTVITSPFLSTPMHFFHQLVRDVDGDGKLDVLVSDQQAFTVARGDGAGGFGNFTTGSFTGTCWDVALADVDADGDLDLVELSGGALRLWLNQGAGTFAASTVLFTVLGDQLSIADFDGDGVLDSATASAPASGPQVTITTSFADASAVTAQEFSIASNARQLIATDMDSDGRTDLVAICDNGVTVAIQKHTGDLLPQTTYWPYSSPRNGAVADVDGDGNPDILASEPPGGALLAIGDGHGGIAAPRHFATGTLPRRISAGDVDGDGRTDVLLSGGAGTAYTSPYALTPHEVLLTQPCAGLVGKVGGGCPGSGGIEPRLWLDGCATAGGLVTLRIEDALGGAQALLFLGVTANDVALPNGCLLHVFPILPVVLALPLSGSGAGNGGVLVPATLPATGLPDLFLMQAVIAPDAGAPGGFATTQAVAVVPR